MRIAVAVAASAMLAAVAAGSLMLARFILGVTGSWPALSGIFYVFSNSVMRT
jgi:hypothetical protein